MTPNLPQTERITAAVITGDHAFDVPGFHHLWRSLADEVTCYIQHQDNFIADVGKVRDEYDVLLFYNMPLDIADDGTGDASKAKPVLEQLGTSGQGIFLLHHALVAYKDWSFWSDLVGIRDRHIDYFHDEVVSVRVVDPDHPITQGMAGWQMVDETYVMADPEESVPLLQVEHPRSMKTIAWTRHFRDSRVFCFQSGHDNQTYVDPNFRRVVLRGIQWCAGRI